MGEIQGRSQHANVLVREWCPAATTLAEAIQGEALRSLFGRIDHKRYSINPGAEGSERGWNPGCRLTGYARCRIAGEANRALGKRCGDFEALSHAPPPARIATGRHIIGSSAEPHPYMLSSASDNTPVKLVALIFYRVELIHIQKIQRGE